MGTSDVNVWIRLICSAGALKVELERNLIVKQGWRMSSEENQSGAKTEKSRTQKNYSCNVVIQ